MRNKLNKQISKEKKRYYRNLFENSRNNMKKSWNIIRKLTGANISKSKFDQIFDEAPSAENCSDTLNRFNDFFPRLAKN